MKKELSNLGVVFIVCGAFLFLFCGCKKEKNPPVLSVTTVVSGLPGPMGIDADAQGNLWVSESGTDVSEENGDTHNDNGKVVVITPSGKVYDAIINLSSYANVHSGELQGTVHILLDKKTLYVLSGDYLYTADISHFKAGDQPIDATTLPKEDIASFASQVPSDNNPEEDSHPYNLTKGPDGDLYIADAGANAILHRKGANNYTVLAEIPGMANPSFPGLGGPTVQPVPTSIEYVGDAFLVTTLTGFPFPEGEAIIYKVTESGQVSIYQQGFTMLVDQAKGKGNKHLVVQHASSFNPQSGYAPNSGSLLWVDGDTTEVLADGFNEPVGIKQINNDTWYVTTLGDGSVQKVTYR